MKIEFNKENHIYFVDGEIAGISVTGLLAKHKLAPNYSAVKPEVLKRASSFGIAIHAEIENCINDPKYTPETKSAQNYREYAYTNYDVAVAEQMLAIKYKGLILAGTADIMAVRKDGTYEIADHKTTAFHRGYVTWQVSLLDYMARKMGKCELNGNSFKWKGADVFKCFTYDKETGEMTEHVLDKIPDSEIEELLDCEANGEIYTPKELVVEGGLMEEFREIQTYIAKNKAEREMFETRERELKALIMNAMKEQGIKSYADDVLSIAYIAGRVDKIIDTDRLKKDYPDLCAKYLKDKKINESIRITMKKEKDV